MSKWSVLSIVLLMIIGLLGLTYYSNTDRNLNSGAEIGIGGGPGNEDLVSPQPSQIRVNLHRLLVEHGVVASNYLEAVYDNEDIDDAKEELDENSQELADLVSQIGGSALRDDFLTMWQGHIKEYENYTNALKENDRSATERSRFNLNTKALEMGQMMNTLIPRVSAGEVTKLTNEHVDLTLGIIEAHAKGETIEKATLMTKAGAQATTFADTLADGIENNND